MVTGSSFCLEFHPGISPTRAQRGCRTFYDSLRNGLSRRPAIVARVIQRAARHHVSGGSDFSRASARLRIGQAAKTFQLDIQSGGSNGFLRMIGMIGSMWLFNHLVGAFEQRRSYGYA